MFKEFSMQLFSVRDTMESYEGIKNCFKALKEMGYSGAQTAGIPTCCTHEEFAAAARDADIKIIGTHVFTPKLEQLDDFIAYHKLLNTTNCGTGGEKMASAKDWIALIDRINRISEELAKHGMKFTYHHSWEFGKIDGVRPIDLLCDGLDKNNTSIVLDTFWVVAAGGDVNVMLEKLAGRVDVLHLKDRGLRYEENTPYQAPLGEGNIEFMPILKTAWDTGVKHICVELDDWPNGTTSLQCAKISADNLKKMLGI